jgi:hypothetical protein
MVRRVTKDDVVEIERLAADGLTVRQVADKIDLTYHQVNNIRRKLDIDFKVRSITSYDHRLSKWERLLPELKANLLRDIAKIN